MNWDQPHILDSFTPELSNLISLGFITEGHQNWAQVGNRMSNMETLRERSDRFRCPIGTGCGLH